MPTPVNQAKLLVVQKAILPAVPAPCPQPLRVSVHASWHIHSLAALLAAGIAIKIIDELARIIARDSSFALSGHDFAPREMGERLNVRYLVDGTAQRIGDTLLFAVQLIDSRDHTVAWADQFSATAADVDRIQPTITNNSRNALCGSCERPAGALEDPQQR